LGTARSAERRHVRLGVYEGNYDHVPAELTAIQVSHPFDPGTRKPPGETIVPILRTNIRIKGGLNPLQLTELQFSAKGATPQQVSNAKLYYTGSSSDFGTGSPVGGTITAVTNGQ